jgi:hypothetical protein
MAQSESKYEIAKNDLSKSMKGKEKTIHQSRLAILKYIDACKEGGRSNEEIRQHLLNECEPSQRKTLNVILRSRLKD